LEIFIGGLGHNSPENGNISFIANGVDIPQIIGDDIVLILLSEKSLGPDGLKVCRFFSSLKFLGTVRKAKNMSLESYGFDSLFSLSHPLSLLGKLPKK